jgi:hypothetical protein
MNDPFCFLMVDNLEWQCIKPICNTIVTTHHETTREQFGNIGPLLSRSERTISSLWGSLLYWTYDSHGSVFMFEAGLHLAPPVAEISVFPPDDESSLGSMGFLFASVQNMSRMVAPREEQKPPEPLSAFDEQATRFATMRSGAKSSFLTIIKMLACTAHDRLCSK